MKVRLSWSEVLVAAVIGITRQISSMSRGDKDKPGVDGMNGWTIHIEGAAGELAYCKARNLYWPATVDAFKSADLGTSIQVRRRIQDWYDLVIRDGDVQKQDDIYVLVVGQIPNFRLVGWIKGVDGMKPEWRKNYADRGEAWFVPQSELKGFDEPELVAAEGRLK